MGTIVIDPVTRIEGHLKVEAVVEGGVVKEARSAGMLFRGFEIILKGRDPRDAQHLTQRVCGVCPTAHALAAALALDTAFGIDDRIPDNGRILRNLIHGSNYLQSHILHFYHLAALDFVDVTDAGKYQGNDPGLQSVKKFIQRAGDRQDPGALGPFAPRYEGDYRLPAAVNQAAVAHYLQALDMRRTAHEMASIFAGKQPHAVAVVPGGVTMLPTPDNITAFYWRLNQLRDFIDNVYIPDVVAVAEAYGDYFGIGVGPGNFLSYGVFDLDGKEKDQTRRKRLHAQGTVSASDLKHRPLDPGKITEEVAASWYSSKSGLHPSEGETVPDSKKDGAYSWLKSPRYEDSVYEVGPLARMLVSYVAGNPQVKKLIDDTLSHFKAQPSALVSVLGRHAARALETKLVADAMAEWVLQLKPGEPISVNYTMPDEGQGVGLWEASRGALGHWLRISGGKIANYQLVVPTTWNASPRDSKEQPGPIEQAIVGTKVKDESNPVEIVRIVRSFDPCIACAVHLVTPQGRDLAQFQML